jgi:REP element-mobilizing transposase RayT
MGSPIEYGRTNSAAPTVGYHLAWCPRHGRRVLVGPTAGCLSELLGVKAADPDWLLNASRAMPDHAHVLMWTRDHLEVAPIHQYIATQSIRSGRRRP